MLQNRLNRPIKGVAYPFGGVTPAVSQLAAAAGYTIGVTVAGRAARMDDDPLALPRVPMSGLEDFAGRIDALLSDNEGRS